MSEPNTVRSATVVAFDNRSKPSPHGVWAHRHIVIYGDDWFYTANHDAARQDSNVAVHGDTP